MNQTSKILSQELNVYPKKDMLSFFQPMNLSTSSNGKIPCYDEFMTMISCLKNHHTAVTEKCSIKYNQLLSCLEDNYNLKKKKKKK